MTQRNWGITLTAIWLIFTGLIVLVNLQFQAISIIMAILALVAGVLLLIGK